MYVIDKAFFIMNYICVFILCICAVDVLLCETWTCKVFWLTFLKVLSKPPSEEPSRFSKHENVFFFLFKK